MFLNDFVNLFVTILFQLCVIHRRSCVSERLLRRHCLPPGQIGITFQNGSHLRTVDQKQVDISAIRLIITVTVPISASLISHIKYSVIGIIVKQSQRMKIFFINTNIKWNMFVQRLPKFRICPNGILR